MDGFVEKVADKPISKLCQDSIDNSWHMKQ